MSSFSNFLLDPQLLASIEWQEPLAVQSTVIPHAIMGKSLVIRSRTGSGKTAAFLLPTIHRILSGHATCSLIIAPTRELCQQIYTVARKLTSNISQISVNNLAFQNDYSNLSASICICTPGIVSSLVRLNHTFDILIIDEADLCIALNSLQSLSNIIKTCNRQVILVSATLDDSCIDIIRKKIDPSLRLVHVSQKESLPDNLCQFWIDCSNSSATASSVDEEKFLLLVSLIQLNLIYPGPILIFSSSTNRSYRIRLILEQFGISACSLNAELPQESRQHTLERYQQGLYDVLITTDRADVSPRGIDFRPVSFVINFDLPDDSTAYVHRVGRTARLDRDGTSISLVGPNDMVNLDKLINEIVGTAIKAYPFPVEQVEGFRYRVRDAMRIANKSAIKQSRVKELKNEMLNSEKLKAYFVQHERDHELLSIHGPSLLNGKISKQFKHTPNYILPSTVKLQSKKPNTRTSNKIGCGRGHIQKNINVLKSTGKGAKLLKHYK